MPRKTSDPRRKCRLTLKELEEFLEEDVPGITDCIPSASDFKFFNDQTAQKNLYVKIGETKVKSSKVQHGMAPVYVGLGDVTGSKMILFNVRTLHPERIIHENKELPRIGTTYLEPFSHLIPLRYEYPSSSFAQSLQWITELRALTMFAFVCGGHRAEFYNFNKGDGLRVLIEVLSRHLDTGGAARENEPDSGVRKNAEKDRFPPCVVTGKDLGKGVDTDKSKEVDAENSTDGEGRVGATAFMPSTTSTSGLSSSGADAMSSRKRTFEDFVVSQEN